jgi:hypothetical protein
MTAQVQRPKNSLNNGFDERWRGELMGPAVSVLNPLEGKQDKGVWVSLAIYCQKWCIFDI